jgi:iron complex outermembrane recepter protein
MFDPQRRVEMLTRAIRKASARSNYRRRCLEMAHALAVTICVAALALPAKAQVSAATSPSDEPGASDSLQEIVVTATRREESVEKVPISIKALSGADLAQSGIKDIADIAAVTPGLQYAEPNGFGDTITTIAIRGMNTQVGASVVGLYLDDTPIQVRLAAIGNVGDTFPVVFDLNRVEVARGPQGTLFGAGSEAGTIRFISNSPSLTNFSAFTHAEVATTQNGAPSAEVGAAAGGPLIEDKLGFRVSIWDRYDGGYIDRVDPFTGAIVDHNANADRKLAIKAALALQLNDAVRITASGFYQAVDHDDTSRFYGNYGGAYYTDASNGTFINGALLPSASSDHLTVPSVKIDAHLSFADLTGVVSYMDRSVNLLEDLSRYYGVFLGGFGNPLGPAFPVSPSDAIPDATGQTVRGLTEEIRLASNRPDAFFTWVGGIFNDHRTQVDFQSLTYAPADPTGPFYYVSEHTTDDQIAVFGQGDFHLTNKWTATFGWRVARVKTLQLDYNGTGLFNEGEPPVAYTSIKETPNTPKASLSYQATESNMFYASAGKGFRVGGGNAPFPTTCGETVQPYRSDSDWSYEVGAKNQFLDHRLQVDTSAFWVKWHNIQLLEGSSCGVAYTANAGDGVVEGFDLALQALVTEGLRLDFDVGYVNAYYTDTVLSFGVPIVRSGDKMYIPPQVNPPWDVNSAANYEIPFAGGKIHLRGEYQYHSRNPGPFITQDRSPTNYAPLEVANPPTHLSNIRLGYAWRNTDITLFVENLFNSHPMLGAFELPPQSNLLTYSTFRPRTVGLSANYQF